MRVGQLSIAWAGAMAVGAHAGPALAGVSHRVAHGLGVATGIDRDAGVALTFDDGPHPEGTPAVLEVLDEAQVKATFFLVGEQVAKQPGLAAEIARRGHLVGTHCHRHRNLLRLTPRQTRDDIARAAEAIAAAVAYMPLFYRPPYGIFNGTALRYLRRRRLQPLLWSAWGKDWRGDATARSIAQLVERDLAPGAVVLLHDADYYSATGSWSRTLAALPAVIEACRERGLPISLPVQPPAS